MKPMTRPRRSTVALVTAALALTLAACGSDEAPEVIEGGDQESPAEAQAAEEIVVETDAGPDSDATQDTPADPDDTDADDSDADGTDGDASGEVEAARAGLARYLEANRPETPTTSTNIPGCPVLEVSLLEAQMADVGLGDTRLEGWGTEIEWNEYADFSPDLMGVACGGDSDGNPNDSDFGTAGGMVAVDLAGHTDFATFVGAMGLDAAGLESEGQEDGDTVTVCPEAGYCMSLWHSDGLVVGVALMADVADEETVGALLDGVLPQALTRLAGN